VVFYDILEEAGFEVYLVNARETKNLPGRKSDVQESQWLMKLHTYGLLRNSFRPAQEIRTMRTYWRQRNDLVRAAGRHIQRMQKALTQMNIQLANVLSDVSGMTGQAIVKAILAGERDPYQLAALRNWRVKASEEEIARSLEGPDDVGEIQTTPSSVSFAVTSASTSLDVPGESCLRNPLREICTVGSVREEIPVVPWWT